jgi:AmpD protein
MVSAIDESGWHGDARIVPSPNFNERPGDGTLSLIVVHNISLPPGEFGTGAIDDLFCNTLDCAAHPFFEELRGLQVSAHFLVDRAGGLTQFVSCNARAWHAGRSSWAGRAECNDYSVGIELEGTDTDPYEAAQYDTLARLVADLRARYPGLGRGAIAGHSDIAPGRKTDPGPSFRWSTLRTLLRTPALEAPAACPS